MFASAICHSRQGLPFKDACVLAFSRQAGALAHQTVTELATFDRQFAKRATKLSLLPGVSSL